MLCAGVLLANDLPLSEQKTELLKLKRNKIEKDADIQKRSWVSPLIFSLSANKSKDTSDLKSNTNSAAVEWSQDLFRSGGIYYTIEQADALREANLINVLQYK